MGRMFRNWVYGHLEYWALGKPNEELWVGCLGTWSTVTWNTGR